MIPDNNLEFIRTRIYDIRTALLYSLSDDIIKLPTSLISVLKVDDKGQIWFLMNRPQQAMEKDEQKFPARLQFYRKGKPFLYAGYRQGRPGREYGWINAFIQHTQDSKESRIS